MYRLKFKVKLGGDQNNLSKEMYRYGNSREAMLAQLLAEHEDIAPTYTEYLQNNKHYYIEQVVLAERYDGPEVLIPDYVQRVVEEKYGKEIFNSIWEMEEGEHRCDVLTDGSHPVEMEHLEIPSKHNTCAHVRVCPICRKVMLTIKPQVKEKLIVTGYRISEKWQKELDDMPTEKAIEILRNEIRQGAKGEEYGNFFFLVRRVPV